MLWSSGESASREIRYLAARFFPCPKWSRIKKARHYKWCHTPKSMLWEKNINSTPLRRIFFPVLHRMRRFTIKNVSSWVFHTSARRMRNLFAFTWHHLKSIKKQNIRWRHLTTFREPLAFFSVVFFVSIISVPPVILRPTCSFLLVLYLSLLIFLFRGRQDEYIAQRGWPPLANSYHSRNQRGLQGKVQDKKWSSLCRVNKLRQNVTRRTALTGRVKEWVRPDYWPPFRLPD